MPWKVKWSWFTRDITFSHDNMERSNIRHDWVEEKNWSRIFLWFHLSGLMWCFLYNWSNLLCEEAYQSLKRKLLNHWMLWTNYWVFDWLPLRILNNLKLKVRTKWCFQKQRLVLWCHYVWTGKQTDLQASDTDEITWNWCNNFILLFVCFGLMIPWKAALAVSDLNRSLVFVLLVN